MATDWNNVGCAPCTQSRPEGGWCLSLGGTDAEQGASESTTVHGDTPLVHGKHSTESYTAVVGRLSTSFDEVSKSCRTDALIWNGSGFVPVRKTRGDATQTTPPLSVPDSSGFVREDA